MTQPTRRRFIRGALGLGATLLAGSAGIARAEPIEYRWVVTARATPLWLDATGSDTQWLPRGTLLRLAPAASGQRIYAWCPTIATFGSIDSASIEDAPTPSEPELADQREAPVHPLVLVASELPGRSVGSANLRLWPDPRPDTLVRRLGHNVELHVLELVQGDDGEPWYRVSAAAAGPNPTRGAAYFVHSDYVRVPRTDFHPTSANPDRAPRSWFEADLHEPAILTAYEESRAVWSSLSLFGKIPDVTPLGDHRILWRVARETMTSERVSPPIRRNAPGGYYLENVLYTQYFDRGGAAIHYNYWASNWGYRASRGCLGLPLAESRWAWDWADHGTPIRIFS